MHHPPGKSVWSEIAVAILMGFLLPLAGARAAPARAAVGAAAPRPSPRPGLDTAGEEDLDLDTDRELLLRSVVQSATKTVTTVQEAPAIINVVTAEDIERFGYRDMMMVMMSLPGHLQSNSQNSNLPYWTVRGVSQAMLYLKDGLSLFDPVFNVVPSAHEIPLENIKRIEVMTNPGGVLWGANSFLGIANIITKDAEDVGGLEMALGFGGIPGGGFKGGPCYPGKTSWYCSPGYSETIRPYLMYGKTFLRGRLKVFAHLSASLSRGPVYETQGIQLYSPPPRLDGPSQFSTEDQTGVVPLSLFGQFDGKVSWVQPGGSRRLVLGWQWQFAPLGQGMARPLSFLHTVPDRRASLAPLKATATNWLNSFVYLLYKDRFYRERIGLSTRLSYARFDREFNPLVVFPYQPGVVEGVAFSTNTLAHRVAWTLDMDFQLHKTLKLLAGAEVFYEWVKGAEGWFEAPMDEHGQLRVDKLSVICPYYDTYHNGLPVYDPNDPSRTNYVPLCRQTFVLDSDRTVFAGYLSASWHPIRRLYLDAGLRLQAAPVGTVGYKPVLLYSGAAVLRLFAQWFLKANYSTGFRSPVFNNTSGNPAMVEYAGDPNIRNERSQAITTEIYGKLARGKGRIQQWDVRLDYAYTELQDRIVILSGAYENAEGTSAIHSVEFLSRLFLRGGHLFSMAYTYFKSWAPNQVNGGFFRSMPNHWFVLSGVFNLLRRGRWLLDLNTTLRVTSAFEDPNRVPTAQGVATDSSVAWDRIPPQAFWDFGARLQVKLGGRPLELRANFYNVLNGRYYNIDPNFALAPRTEQLPTPLQRFHFFIQLRYIL